MRIELDNDLFCRSISPAQLFSLLFLALEGRHRLMVRDDTDETFVTWLASLPQDQQAEWELCLSEAYELESREPADRAIVVTANAAANWESNPPTVSLAAAVGHLQRPFIVFLEDSESDKGFLLSIATAEQRAFLVRMEKLNALQFEHGGGISNMPRRLNSLLKDAGDNLRFWAMFDSDGLQPGTWSEDAERLSIACQGARVPFHRLQRRAIENYLPDKALHHWAWSPHNAARKRLVRAFRRLSLDQRSHFNMKAGFNRDAKRTDLTAGTLYDGISDADSATLGDGFGDRVAELFSAVEIYRSDLDAEGSWDELSRMVARLISLIR